MRILLALLILLVSAHVEAQNLTANRLQLLPAIPGTCPVGKVCVVGTTSTAPYRVAFQDASGNLVTMGDAWRLRQCAGPCVGALNGDTWFDSATGIAYIKLSGTPVVLGSAGSVPTTRVINTTAPLTGGGSLATDKTIALSTGTDLTTSGGALVFATNVRASVIPWNLSSALSLAANDYWGPGGDSSATATLVSPLLVPCTGTVIGMRAQGNADAIAATTLTIHKSAGGAVISYTALAITCTIGLGTKFCADTVNTAAVTAGDLLLVRATVSNWSPSGGSAAIRIACDPT